MDGEIGKVSIDTTPLFPRDGSRSMTGDLNMDNNHILSVKNLNDYKVDDAYGVRVRDLGSVVNKEYPNEKFLKVDKDGNYFDLKQNTIKNCEPYYDGLFDDNSLVSKAFVDAEISKLPKPATDVLKLDGSKAMNGALDMGGFSIKNIKPFVEDDSSQAAQNAQLNDVIDFGYFHAQRGELTREINDVAYEALNRKNPDPMEDDIDMANHSIINLKDPQPSDVSPAASVNFIITSINHSNTIIDGIIDSKIKESERLSIESNDIENVFKKVMDDDLFKEDDDDIHKVGVQNNNFHSVNKKTYEFKIDYDSSIGYYSTRLSIDLIYLPIGSYTMVYEMYVDDGITIDEIDAVSGTLSVGKINSRIDGTNTRSIIHFAKHTIHHGFDDLDIDIKLKSKTDPRTTIHVVVYGVKGYVNNVSVNLWDRLYYYDNDSIEYEVQIKMNGKDIIDVNKITTKYLDGNDNIDMKNRQIKNVGDGNENADAVNIKQLNESESITTNYVNSEIENKNISVNNKINIILDSILFKQETIEFIQNLYFPDHRVEHLSGEYYVFKPIGGNDEGEITLYYVFQHNSSTNNKMTIAIFYLGMMNPLNFYVNKSKVIIRGHNIHTTFNIPNICLGKQVWFWIWIHNSYLNVVFSGLSPKKFSYITERNNLSAVRFYDTNLFPQKRGLITKNIYDSKSEVYLKIKKIEDSEGTIT